MQPRSSKRKLPADLVAATRRSFDSSPRWSRYVLQASVILCMISSSPYQLANDIPAAESLFNKVESILIKRCSECHGADVQKANLRLDTKVAALKGGKSGKPALVPGKPLESELYRRIITHDQDDIMPPKGAMLLESETSLIKSWIEQGAHWVERAPSQHWAFKPIISPDIPKNKSKPWGINGIDQFIQQKLEKQNLRPSPKADKHTLLRRVFLDLTGLPPTISDIENFERDTRPTAYEELVDKLLRSPHHGEHAARAWLDLARYADSNGYQVDLSRSMWPYRDWVVRAFNANMPFDQFTVEQLAGDLLPNATLSQKIATGFNRNTKINDEGGGDAEEYRTKAVKDRVATTSTTWLGLTMMCAECHTHKYDPLTQEDYYRFYAFFNNSADGGNYSVEPTIPVPPPNLVTQTEELRIAIQSAQRDLNSHLSRLPELAKRWEDSVTPIHSAWSHFKLTNAISTGGASYTAMEDGSLLATGVNPTYDTILVEAVTHATNITAILLEVLPDPSLPKNGPGRWSQTGNFILDEMGLSIEPITSVTSVKPLPVQFSKAYADWEQTYYKAEHAVDGNPKTGWAIAPHFATNHFLIAELSAPIGRTDGLKLSFRFDHYHGNNHSLGRFRLSYTTETNPQKLWPRSEELLAALKTPRKSRSASDRQIIESHVRRLTPEIRNIENTLYRLNQRETELANTRFTTLVMAERKESRTTYIHNRGNFLDKGITVVPGVPQFLPPLDSSAPANRLALAKWLVSSEHPLTARVTVNRIWERFFGTGLVKTSEDFGLQGELPSHPELLDWLASKLIKSGWNLKEIQKLIVMSATYQQSTKTEGFHLEKDLYNRLLARGPRFRLEGEVIRDLSLSVSGLLDLRAGGPSVYPEQVPNLWKEIGFLRPEIGMDEWPTSFGSDLNRRSIYTFWRRVCTYPVFATFDAPSRDVCVARRPRTNTPLQALAALNDKSFMEMAKGLATRIHSSKVESPKDKIDYAFQLCTARRPKPEEKNRLLKLYHEQLQTFLADVNSAKELLGKLGAEASVPEKAKLAAWTIVANVLLNLDETLNKG